MVINISDFSSIKFKVFGLKENFMLESVHTLRVYTYIKNLLISIDNYDQTHDYYIHSKNTETSSTPFSLN